MTALKTPHINNSPAHVPSRELYSLPFNLSPLAENQKQNPNKKASSAQSQILPKVQPVVALVASLNRAVARVEIK